MAYIGVMMNRSDRYVGERDYYTDDDSPAAEDWEMGSIYLEEAVKQINKDNRYQSYYWTRKADKSYQRAILNEDRQMLREAASSISAGCNYLSVSTYTKSNQSRVFRDISEQCFTRAKEQLSHRVCDLCGNVRTANRCSYFNNNGKREIYCQSCIHRGKVGENYREKRTSKTNTRSKRNELDNIDEYKSILGLDGKIDKQSVNDAFRNKMKSVHPDVGGSAEEFKDVKEARERLLDHLDS